MAPSRHGQVRDTVSAARGRRRHYPEYRREKPTARWIDSIPITQQNQTMGRTRTRTIAEATILDALRGRTRIDTAAAAADNVGTSIEKNITHRRYGICSA